MVRAGIEDIGIYIPRGYVSLEKLAQARGVEVGKYTNGLCQEGFAFPFSNEDVVTIAANALENLLLNDSIRLEDIGRLLVATETPLDCSKTIGNYLAGLFDIPTDCEVYEVKHSCIAGTFALFDALNWLRSGQNDGRKAVVICTDIAQYEAGSASEPTQGAGAVAILVSENPKLLSIDSVTGTATKDCADFWKPLWSDTAMVNGQLSIDSYLEGLRLAFEDYEQKGGNTQFDYCVFHNPFGKMVKKAYKTLSELLPELKGRFEEKTAQSLAIGRTAGNAYTASLDLALASLLLHEGERARGKSVGMFSFGSGYSAKLFRGTVEGKLRDITLPTRVELSIEEYDNMRSGQLHLEEHEGFLLQRIDERGYRYYTKAGN